MSKSDEGHYELVLGNRQLISGFFVLVILFAIFLTLGYILGRNSVVTDQTVTMAGAGGEIPLAEQHPAVAGGADRPSASEGVPEQAVNNPEPEPQTMPAPAPAVTTSPAAAPAPAPVTESARPAAVPQTAAAVNPEKPSSAARTREILGGRVQLITPRKGDVFLQVAAIGRAEAEVMAEQLRKRGHRAFLSEVPNRDLFRVLIGPFETTARLNEAKKKLTDEGLPTLVQRY